MNNVNSNFLYVEPNFNISEQQLKPVDLEDLCVAIELKVDYYKKVNGSMSINNGAETLSLKARVLKNGDNPSLFNGITIDSSNDSYLSTDGYDSYTWKNIGKKNSEELFGIESIDISYNSFQVPEVVIKFTDIKGAALHAAEELVRNDKGEINEENVGNDAKFLNCFFSVPYPKFELIVKGFYGKPVYYDLTCATFKSSFNHNTGNYNAVAKLVGYSFALISDVTLDSILVAPYSKYVGEDYWNQQINEQRFVLDNNCPMPRLMELVELWNSRLQNINENKEKTNTQNELQREQLIQNNLQETLNHLQIYYSSINTVLTTKANEKYNCVCDTVKGAVLIYSKNAFNVEKKNFNDTLYERVIEEYDKVNENGITNFTQIQLQKGDAKTIIKKLDEARIDSQILIKSYQEIKNIEGDVYYCLINDSKKIEKIRLKKDKQAKKTQNVNSRFEEEINEMVKNVLSFKPTIYNITKIIFAHLETLLYTFKQVSNEVKNTNRKPNSAVFPEFFKIVPRGNKKYEEKVWIGDEVSNSDTIPEVKMVKGMIDGILLSSQNKNQVQNGIVQSQSLFEIVTPYDVISSVNPFKGGITVDTIVGRLVEIFMLGFNRTESGGDEEYAKKLGRLDALNYIAANPMGQSGLAEIINKDLWAYDFVIKQFSNLAVKNDQILNYLTIDEFNDIRSANRISLKEIKNDDVKCYCFRIIDDLNLYPYFEEESNSGWQTTNKFEFDKYFSQNTAMVVPICSNQETIEIYPYNEYYSKIKSEVDGMYEITADIGFFDSDEKYMTQEWEEPNRLNIKNDIVFNAELHTLNKTFKIERLLLSDDTFNIWHDESLNVFRTLKCHENMDSSTYTLISICGFKRDTWKGMETTRLAQDTTSSLFTDYYYQDISNIYAKAFLFLSTFDWSKYEQNRCLETLFFDNGGSANGVDSYIEVMPYFLLLKICAYAYALNGDNNIIQAEDYIKLYHHNRVDRVDFKNYDYYLIVLKKIKKSYLKKLSDYFVKWVDIYYTQWDKAFTSAENAIKTKKRPNLYYASLYFQDGASVRLFRETHPIVKEMTSQLFKLVALFKATPFLLDDDNWKKMVKNRDDIKKDEKKNSQTTQVQSKNKKQLIKNNPLILNDYIVNYCNAFNEELKKQFKGLLNSETTDTNNLYLNRDIEINLYEYFKQIWDKWLVSTHNTYNDWTLESVLDINNQNRRIHFLDSSYNYIGDDLQINIQGLVDLLINAQKGENYPLLSFLGKLYEKNNCLIYNIQNFLDSQDKKNIETLFKPLPYTQIKDTDIKRYSDLIVLYNYKPSSTTNDYFNITGDSDSQNLPQSIITKDDSSFKIPAFGVTYGMQNQNYFQDVNVSMNTPVVTEQVINVLMKIASENLPDKEHTNEITSIGQDMYTVYANQAYQCDVKMMGCAWIQPLMYFQLNNIPLFSGAYIIHKVNHSVTPNGMITSFVGTRIARSSMKMIDSSFYYHQRQMLKDKYNLKPENLATVTNNCNYAFYDPSNFGDEKSNKLDNIISAINYSLSKTNGLSSVTVKIEKRNNFNHIVADTTNIDLKAMIFDLILQTYHSYFSKIYWIVDAQSGDNYDDIWESIQIVEKNDENTFQVGVKQHGNVISTHEGLNRNFYMSIMKFFDITDDNVNQSFKTECTIFNKLTNNQSWKKNVIAFFKNLEIIIQNCDKLIDDEIAILSGSLPSPNVDTPPQYQWVGDGSSIGNGRLDEKDKDGGKKLLNNDTKYWEYAKTNIKSSGETGGQCAKYVRTALENCGFIMETRPNSACAYWRYLEWWGFERIYYGFSRQYKGELKDGDIVVMAGLTQGSSIYGHIQIYCDKEWYADKLYHNICVYEQGDRPCFIYRLPDNIS